MLYYVIDILAIGGRYCCNFTLDHRLVIVRQVCKFPTGLRLEA